MSELVGVVAIVGVVAVVAVVFGRGFHWKTGRNGCETSVAEEAARKENEESDRNGKKAR